MLSTKETNWTSLEARTHSTFLKILISKGDFGPIELPGHLRNRPGGEEGWLFSQASCSLPQLDLSLLPLQTMAEYQHHTLLCLGQITAEHPHSTASAILVVTEDLELTVWLLAVFPAMLSLNNALTLPDPDSGLSSEYSKWKMYYFVSFFAVSYMVGINNWAYCNKYDTVPQAF